MSVESRDDAEERTREVRLGLVMYGGVSLAIYINGVAAEFFRMVRGRGVYRWIKALTDSDIVVDIISGTSAGGINGILLAYALCNDKDFLSSAMLWRRDGDIRSLLRSPNRETEVSSSLLDSEGYFQPRLEEAFRYMPDYKSEEGEIRSDFGELDLFVTGTDVDGNISTQFDDAGHAIDVKDHRSVFLLKHRRGRKHPFDPDLNDAGLKRPNPEATLKALAKLSRITSCFPGAFSPVQVTAQESDEDRILQSWGQLGKESCFLDGGVIDNKPFTYTLREIFERCANRQIDRKLFYVEPDPERFSQIQHATNPNIYEAVIASLIGIPGYESIADDLKLLATHNSKLNQYKRLIRCVDSFSTDVELSPAQRRIYEQSRLIAISERVVRGILREDGKDKPLSLDDRRAATALVSAFDNLVEGADSENETAMVYAKRVVDRFDVYFRLRRLYRMIYLIAEKLYDKKNPVQGEKRGQYRRVWQEFNRQIQLLEILRVRMEDLIDRAPIEWKESIEKKLDSDEQASLQQEMGQIWSVVSLAMRNFLCIDEHMRALLPEKYQAPANGAAWLDQKKLSALNKYLGESVVPKIAHAIQASPLNPGLPEPDSNLLSRSDDYERQILKSILDDSDDIVHRSYQSFRSLDALLFPIEMIGDLHEKDIIQTIRVSPADAEKGFSNKSLADKVSGDALYHFGGFFKRSWRSNDILWGRLDSCCQLIESLLDRERLIDLLDSREMRKKLRGYFSTNPDGGAIQWKASMDPATLFPQSGKPTHKALRLWVDHLLSDDDSKRAVALERDEFKNRICWLIEAAQLEIIKEDLPGVISDALEEQAQWNQFRVPKLELEPEAAKTYVGPFAFSPVKGNLDPFVSVMAAAGQTQSVMHKLRDLPKARPKRPTKTRLGQFFLNEYKIGTEALLKDMPSLILLEILSVSLLVLRNCLLYMFGERAEKIKRNPLYVFVNYLLRAFNALVLFIRRAPIAWKVSLAVFFFLSVIALAVGITWRDSIIYKGGDFYLRWFLVFIVVPTVIIFSQGLFLWRGRVHKVGVRRVAVEILRTLLVLAPLALLLVVAYSEVAQVYEDIASLAPAESGKAAEFQKAISSLLTSAAAFVSVAFILGGLWIYFVGRRFLRARRGKPKDLQYALQDFFDFEEITLVAKRMNTPPNTLPDIPRKINTRQGSELKRKMAASLVEWAKGQKRLSDLETSMRAINPAALYDL